MSEVKEEVKDEGSAPKESKNEYKYDGNREELVPHKLAPLRKSALAAQIKRRMDRQQFQKRFEAGEKISDRTAKLDHLFENRPTKQWLQNQGVIKKSSGSLSAATESFKNSQKKDKLNILFATRSDRRSLVDKGILLTIREDEEGMAPKEKIVNRLEGLLQARSDKEILHDRGILKTVEEGEHEREEKMGKIKKLDTLLERRSDQIDLKTKGYMRPEKIDLDRRIQQKHMNHLILARPNKAHLQSQGIFRSVADDKNRRKQFGIRKLSLSNMIASRPKAQQLVEQKIIADIGDLPGLNIKPDSQQLTPQLVESFKDIKGKVIDSGSRHTIVLDEEGCAYICGSGSNGRLGIGEDAPEFTPDPILIKPLKDLGAVTKIVSGDNHCAAIVDGKLYTWGSDNWGMCGIESKSDLLVPSLVEFDSKIVDVACGTYHTLILTEKNQVHSFGWRKNGRLGTGKHTASLPPKESIVSVISEDDIKVVSLFANQGLSIALTADGRAYSWGAGSFGGTGHGDEHDCHVPKLIEGLKDEEIIEVSLSSNFGHALTKSGNVYSWGNSKSGQLGRDGNGVEAPAMIEELKDIVKISSGNYHTLAADKDGVLYVWGKGSRGVLGMGSEENVLKPTPVEALKGKKVISMTGSFGHSGVVIDDGSVYTWGRTQHGKLGYLPKKD